MEESDLKTTPAAAYLAFRTFMSAIESLEQGVPKRLDRTMWKSQSGQTQGQIMMALRFFGLIDDDDVPTVALHRLIAPENKDRRPEQIGALLRHAYKGILDHDLTRMTPKMLEELMSDYNVQGDTRRKAVTFFLQAARYADLPMHPLLFSQIRTSSPRRKRKKSPAENNGAAAPRQSIVVGHTTTKKVELASGTTITVEIVGNWLEMSSTERDYVFGLVDKLQAVPPGLKAQAVK